MAINVATSFNVQTNLPIDERMVLSKAQMLGVNDNVMPQTYMATCTDDGKLYIYNKNNIVNNETGKFKIVESGGGGATIDDITPATDKVYSSSKVNELVQNIYTHIGTADDGTVGCIWIE